MKSSKRLFSVADIPSGSDIKRMLKAFKYADMLRVREASGVPVSTMRNIRDHEGEPNPGVNTVRKLLPHLAKA
jgi:hypothetical protein